MSNNYNYDVEEDVEDESEDESEEGGDLALVFTVEGTAILEEDGELVWASDDDDDFAVEFGDEFLDADEDSTGVLNYLEEEGYLEEDEKSEVEIQQETNGDENEDGDVD